VKKEKFSHSCCTEDLTSLNKKKYVKYETSKIILTIQLCKVWEDAKIWNALKYHKSENLGTRKVIMVAKRKTGATDVKGSDSNSAESGLKWVKSGSFYSA